MRVGSLTISRSIGGRDVVLSYVPAGNYVGEMAIIGGGKRSATAKAAGIPFALFTEGYRKTPVDQIPHQQAFDDWAHLPTIAAALAR